MKFCSKFEYNRTIRGGVIAISIFDHDIELRVTCCARFTEFDLRHYIRAWIIAFCNADTLCHAVTVNFDQLNLKDRGCNRVPNFRTIRRVHLSYWWCKLQHIFLPPFRGDFVPRSSRTWSKIEAKLRTLWNVNELWAKYLSHFYDFSLRPNLIYFWGDAAVCQMRVWVSK